MTTIRTQATPTTQTKMMLVDVGAITIDADEEAAMIGRKAGDATIAVAAVGGVEIVARWRVRGRDRQLTRRPMK